VNLNLARYFAEAKKSYFSPSQRARFITEKWARDNLYCPRCGLPLQQYRSNTKVYDFYCDHSNQEFSLITMPSLDNFQLKGMRSFPHNYYPRRIVGAEYSTTVKSLKKGNFPSLILLHYEPKSEEMRDGLFIHRLSVTLESIYPRKPLSRNARRKGWQGSIIDLDAIPQVGQVPVIKNSRIIPKNTVLRKWDSVERILQGNISQRSWITDILLIVDRLQDSFYAQEVYAYQPILEKLHPNNKHIKDKIRQQLQLLRDRGYLVFQGNGKYMKLRRND
jgi:type II restriction enzyme